MIDFDTFEKLPKTVVDLSKLIVAKGFKKSPKVRKIAKSGHTDPNVHDYFVSFTSKRMPWVRVGSVSSRKNPRLEATV